MIFYSNEELLSRYQQGDLKAFELFYDKNYSLIFHFILSRCSSEEHAEELLQDSFIKLHKAILTYNTNQMALPWFFTIIRNTLIDFYRKKKEVPLQDMDIFESSIEQDNNKHGLYELEEVLADLKPKERHILERRFLKEMSYEDIASEEGTSLIALRKRISRILQKLRLKIES